MIIKNVDELKQWVKKNLIPQLAPKTVVLLEGEMGVGKTQLVKVFCENFGCQSEVSSPTFAIIQEYPSSLGVIHHIDLYRIEGDEELENTGFWEVFHKSKGLVFVEWPQKMDRTRIPKEWKVISIKYDFQDENRKIEMK